MNPLQLLRWETRRFFRSGAAWLALGLLFASGLLALWSADRELRRQEAEFALLQPQYETQMERIAHRFASGEHAGYVAYYTFFPTHHVASPLAHLSLGLRDVAPVTHWVRLLGLEGQLYETGIGNPALQSLHTFDLAFVCNLIAPLILLLLCHDLLTREREEGILPLLLSQSSGLSRVFVVRLLVRFSAVALTCLALSALALFWHRLPLDQAALGWCIDFLITLLCWAALAAVIALLARTLAASLACALAAWTTLVVLVPALLNLIIVAAHPVPEGLELTVRQRQAIHSGWDLPKETTFAQFFKTHPEWSSTPPVTERFAWKWYYAMHQVGDESVAAESTRFRENLLARSAALQRWSWLSPAISGQLLFARRAHTDLEAHLAHLDRVRAFHRELRMYFYPLVFAEKSLSPADYAAFPTFRPAAPSAGFGTLAERLPLLLPLGLFALLALALLRRPPAAR